MGKNDLDTPHGEPNMRNDTTLSSIQRRNCSPIDWLRPLCLLGVLLYVLYKPVKVSIKYQQWSSSTLPLSQPLTIEQRARGILEDNPLVDGHNDLLIYITVLYANRIYSSNFTHSFEEGGLPGQVDIPRINAGSYSGAFWSAFMPCPLDIYNFTTPNYDPVVRATLAQLDLFRRLGNRYPRYFTPTPSAKAARAAFSQGILISPLAIEGLHQIGNSFSTLRLFHALGVRYATLTWNCHNAFADSAVLTFARNRTSVKAPPYWGGLSKQGRKVILEMNRLGVIVDLSHVSVNTMRDVLVGEHNDQAAVVREASDEVLGQQAIPEWRGSLTPPIFSHSSVYSLCPHPRNVPDSILKLVQKRNSIVMVNFNPEFISCTAALPNSTTGLPEVYPANATLHQVARHITYIGDRIGFAHVGIGSDFDGIASTPTGLEDVSKIPDLVKELLKMGVSDEDVKKVVGGNLLRVWRDVDQVSSRLQSEGWLPAEDHEVQLLDQE